MLKPRPGPQILAQPRQAYATPSADVTAAERFQFADYEADFQTSGRYRHIVGGAQSSPVAQCPNCERPLTQLLMLDTSDPRLQLTDWKRDLRLLFCWRCALPWTPVLADYNNPEAREEDVKRWAALRNEWYTENGWLQTVRLRDRESKSFGNLVPFYYRVNEDNSVTLLQYIKGPVVPDWPYPDYPDAFPEAPATLLRLTAEVQDAVRASNLGEDAKYLDEGAWPDFEDFLDETNWHQIGGEPWLPSGWYTMPCPRCSQPMPFLAHIQDPCADPRGFVGGKDVDVHFHACVHCCIIGAYSHFN
jgi:hypothetical protein